MRGGVVLVPEAFGADDALRMYAGRLEAAGFAVALPELWHEAEPRPADGAAIVARIADSRAMQDLAAARATLPSGPVFVIGFCLGGLYARMAASVQVGLRGAVEFYGRIVYPAITPEKPVQPLDLLPGLACPLQCHFGTADTIAPDAHVAELERRLAARPVAAQVFRYPGCAHAFMNPARPAWNPEAAATAWARAMNFLGHLAPS